LFSGKLPDTYATAITCKLLPSEAADENIVSQHIARAAGVKNSDITGYHIQKKSIDARGKQAWVNLTVTAFINEPFTTSRFIPVFFKDVSKAGKKVIIIGAGPCGLFAALKLIEQGIQPIILERGKNVRDRRRDLASLNKEGIITRKVIIVLVRVGRVPTAMENYIPAVIKGEISTVFYICCFSLARLKIFYLKHIRILVPINCHKLLRPCVSKLLTAAVYFFLKKNVLILFLKTI